MKKYVSFIISLICLAGFIVSAYVYNSNNTKIANYIGYFSDKVNEKVITLERKYEEINTLLNKVAYFDDVITLLTEEVNSFDRNQLQNDIRLFINFLIDYRHEYNFYIYNKNREYYHKNYIFQQNDDFEKTTWYNEAMNNDTATYWFGLHKNEYFYNTNEYVFIASKQIKWQIKGTYEVIGIVYVSIKEGYFSILSSEVPVERENLYIVNDEGKVIFSDNKSFIGTDIKGMLFDFKDSSSQRIETGRYNYVFLSEPNKYGWRIIDSINMEERLANMQTTGRVSILSSIMFFMVLLFFLYHYTTYTKYAFRKMLLLKYGENLITTQILNDFNREKSFFDDTIKNELSFEDRMLRIEDLYKKSELKKIQAQMNPHFLYNVLDSIKFIAMLNNQDKIIKVTECMFHILKKNLSEGENMIKLSEEVENLTYYINIIDVLYDENIKFSINISKSLYNTVVPKFILQPLVENSVCHGINPGRKGGEITIKGHRSKKNIIIEVIDNGRGMTEQTIKEVLDYSDAESKGISSKGVRNTDQKIKLLCGDKYGLKILSKYKEGTKVILELPYRLDDYDDSIKEDLYAQNNYVVQDTSVK